MGGVLCQLQCGVVWCWITAALTSIQIDWRDAFRPFIQDWRYIVWALLALGLGVPLASVGNFLPQIGTSGFGDCGCVSPLCPVVPRRAQLLVLYRY